MPNDYFNKVFNDIVGLCRSCRNNGLAHATVPKRKASTCCNSLTACGKSFLTSKMLFVAPLVKKKLSLG